MKVQFNRQDDVLLLHLSEEGIDHAEESEGVIIHFSEEDRPVLLEVLDASDLLSSLTKVAATAPSGEVVSISR